MVQWTQNQKEAIYSRNSNLLLSAAAGSGKTAVLVERILQLILSDGRDIDRFLIVTFTNAAAGEMRERINRALHDAIEEGTWDEAHLRRQIQLLDRAHISTIHSFCLDVVRKYFHLIEIDPVFRIGDSTETTLLKLEALEELMEEEYAKEDQHFLELVEMYGGNRDDVGLQNLILQLYDFIQSKPQPKEWLEERIGDFAMDLGDHYRSKKQEQGMVDFNDLEHYALSILEYPEAVEEYRERFDYIFVDEYQDSNLIQETIVNRIKSRDNVFLVGDVKQSIYRFRLEMCIRDRSEWRDLRRSMIQGLFHHNQTEEVGREQAKWMYSYPIRTSVSRLENFVRCPFSHFIKYGLRPKEIKEYKVEAPDIGLLFHDSIALFTEELNKDKLDWTKMDRETTEELVERVIDGMVVDYGEGVFQSTHRYRYLVNRLKRVSKRAVWILTSHLKQGEFQFMGHELVFGRGGHFPPLEVELADGSRIYLEGRIDRIDILEGEEEDYIKIIDYKSGDRDLKLADIYHGLNLQLILYLHAIMKNMGREKTIKPAGIFYYRIDDPMVQSDERVVEVVEEEIERQLKMKGLVLKLSLIHI